MLLEYNGKQTEYFADNLNDTVNMTGSDWSHFDQKLPHYKKVTRVTKVEIVFNDLSIHGFSAFIPSLSFA